MATTLVHLLIVALTVTSTAISLPDEHLNLVAGQSMEMQIIPKVPLSTNALAARVHIHGLSRLKNLKRFSHSLLVKVSHVNSTVVDICFHRNSSLGIGMCPQGQWQRLSKNYNYSWAKKMSPFDHKILDFRVAKNFDDSLQLTVQEEFCVYRVVFLVLGTVLLTLAPALSESLVFYYSSAMAVGVILVVLVVLFQGMKILPTGRGNSLAIVIYSSIIGVGSFFLRYVPQLLRAMLVEIGVSEDVYYPLAVFFVLFISLAGAWLGFWVVRKLVLTDDGSIDTTVSQFVSWSIRILAAGLILQCSLDPLLAAEALVFSILVSSVLRRVARPRLLRRLYRKFHRAAGIHHLKPSKQGLSPAVREHTDHANNIHFPQNVFLSPQSRRTSQTPYSPVKGSAKTPLPPFESDAFYSTYHNTPQRRKLSDEEWKAVTKESTKKGLEELVSSPEFSRWALAHADRITLAPIDNKSGHSGGWRRWFSWFK